MSRKKECQQTPNAIQHYTISFSFRLINPILFGSNTNSFVLRDDFFISILKEK